MPAKKREIKHIIGISDTHVGSTVAVWPDGFVTATGNALLPNPIQRWYLNCFEEFIHDWVPKVTNGQPFALVCNGDTIEGIHHRSKQIVTHDVGDQLSAFIALFGPLIGKAEKVFLTLGTECHTQQSECFIGKELGAEIDPETGLHAFDVLRLEKWGKLFSFQHHIGTTARKWTAATAPMAALANERLEAIDAGRRPPDYVVRAHRHVPGVYWDDSGHAAVITGAWQSKTRHTHKVVPDAICKPSAVCFSAPEQPGGPVKISPRIWMPEDVPTITL
jgi:hypothetical protein